MKTLSLNKLMFVALLSAITIVSCKKDKKEEETDKDTTSALDYATSDAVFNDVANISDEAASGSLHSYKGESSISIFSSCATVTIDMNVNPHRITIDFGTVDCLCLDQNLRRGKIYVDFTGNYRDSASTHTISFDNYYVNLNKIGGTKTVTNNGRNANGNLTFTIVINGSIIWASQYGGGTSTHISNRMREWIAGENTILNWADDVYKISGTASGTNRIGGNYTMNTVTPLRIRIGYRYFTEGIVDFTPAGKATREIDYGYLNGAEDNLARVTINGYTFTVTLR